MTNASQPINKCLTIEQYYRVRFEVMNMTTRQRIAQELQMKEERISAWEGQGLDRDFCEIPRVEYWYIEE
jgi:hypothetical protein